jgi:hypothetical protein
VGIGTGSPSYKLEVVGSAKVETLQLDTTFDNGTAEGRLQWNSEDGTLECGLPGGNVNLQIGQEVLFLATNKSGVTIPNGAAVYIDGAQGNRPTIALARADSALTSAVSGVATEEILNNANGYVTSFGLVRDVDTDGCTAGSVLYLSPTTAGEFTTTRPTAPDIKVFIGYCIFENVSTGIIAVNPTFQPNLNSLSDVLEVPFPTDGQILHWDNGDLRFEKITPGSVSWTWSADQTFNANVKLNFSDSQIYGDGTHLHIIPDVGSSTGKLKIADGVEIANEHSTDPILKLTASSGSPTGEVIEALTNGGVDLFKVDSLGYVYGPDGTNAFRIVSQTDNVSGIDRRGCFDFQQDVGADASDYFAKFKTAAAATILTIRYDGRIYKDDDATDEYCHEAGTHTIRADWTFQDDQKLYFGTSLDGGIWYDTTTGNLRIQPNVTGGGGTIFEGSANTTFIGSVGNFIINGQGNHLAFTRGGTNVIQMSTSGGWLTFRDNASSDMFAIATTNCVSYVPFKLPDSVEFRLGTGNDSRMWYNGADTYWNLRSAGTGDLIIQNGSVQLDDAPLKFEKISEPSTPASSYGSVFLDTSDNILKIKHDDGSVVNLENGSVATPFDIYMTTKTRNAEDALHGGLQAISTANALSSGSPINDTIGLGKVLISIIAGSDTAGTITVTGTSVDRETGAETGSDTDTLTIAGVTTDGSSTDANGVATHSFTNAYITSKWFRGAVAISTTDVNLSDVDVYSVAFEQANDQTEFSIDTLDISAFATNSSAWISAHLYSLEVTGDTCNITAEADAVIQTANINANKWYRLRRGNIAKTLDGSTDGFWCDLNLGPLANNYWENVNGLIWTLSPLSGVVAVGGAGSFDPGTSYTWTADQTVNDNVKWKFGTGGDSYFTYDGTNLVCEPNAVGTGKLQVNGDFATSGPTNTWRMFEGYQQWWDRAGANYQYATATGGYFIWRTNGETTARMALTSGGNLQVAGANGTLSLNTGNEFNADRAGANWFKCTTAGGYWLWRVNGAGTAMYLDTAGDLHLSNDNQHL